MQLKQFQQKSGTKSPLNVILQQSQPTAEEIDKTNNLNNCVVTDSQHVSNNSTACEIQVTSNPLGQEAELLHTIEILIGEKNGLLASNSESQKAIEELQLIKADYEKQSLANETEKALLLQQLHWFTNQKDLQDTELKNTVSILIEEKNDLAAAHNQCQSVLKKMEEDSIQLKKNFESLQENYNLLQSAKTNEDAKSELDNSSALIDELGLLKEELKLKIQLHSDLNEEHEELHIRHSKQTTDLHYKESMIKDLNSRIEMLNLNLEQVKLLHFFFVCMS